MAKLKYKNKKVDRIVKGNIVKFDSIKEAKRYDDLYLLDRGKKISELSLQPKFVLQDGFRDNTGKKHIAITYSADFKYIKDGIEIIEDTKGFKTEVYNIKKKLLLFKYPHLNFIES